MIESIYKIVLVSKVNLTSCVLLVAFSCSSKVDSRQGNSEKSENPLSADGTGPAKPSEDFDGPPGFNEPVASVPQVITGTNLLSFDDKSVVRAISKVTSTGTAVSFEVLGRVSASVLTTYAGLAQGLTLEWGNPKLGDYSPMSRDGSGNSSSQCSVDPSGLLFHCTTKDDVSNGLFVELTVKDTSTQRSKVLTGKLLSIASVSASTSAAGVTSVINGAQLSTIGAVHIDGTACTGISWKSPTLISCLVAQLQTGMHKVSIKSSIASSAEAQVSIVVSSSAPKVGTFGSSKSVTTTSFELNWTAAIGDKAVTCREFRYHLLC